MATDQQRIRPRTGQYHRNDVSARSAPPAHAWGRGDLDDLSDELTARVAPILGKDAAIRPHPGDDRGVDSHDGEQANRWHDLEEAADLVGKLGVFALILQ